MPKAPPSLPYAPFGMRLPEASVYCGVSPSKFLAWVDEGVLPKPKARDRVRVWLRPDLEHALTMLPGGERPDDGPEPSGWEDVR